MLSLLLLGDFIFPCGRFLSFGVARAVDPVSFSVRSVLEFLQEKFDAGEAAITLRVYVTNIAARQESDEVPLGMLSLVSLFIHCVGA